MHKTEQEKFWVGEFGDEYTKRNRDDREIARRVHLFSKILSRTRNVESVIELGANIGHNLIAIHQLLPDVSLSAIEISRSAVERLQSIDFVSEVLEISIHEFKPQKTYDFVFTRGVLIHINPDKLNDVYSLLYHCCRRYICLIEYYNPTPVEVEYRGHKGALFKRDFAGEVLEMYSDLELVDYGFIYRKDPNFQQDDVTWFLLRKK